MMNVLGLSLTLISLAAAGVFSPTPTQQQHLHNNNNNNNNNNMQGDYTIVKEGHRVVVVEYDQDGHHNTKISISPPHDHHNHDDMVTNVIDNAKHKIKEAASVVPDMMQQGGGGGGGGSHHHDATFLHAPKELICDAYGRCKHKIADAMGKAKDKISDTAHEAIHMHKDMIHANKEMAREAGDAVADAFGRAKETVYQQTKDSVDKAKEKGQTLKEDVVRNVTEAKDSLGDAVKRGASNLVESVETVMGVANLLGFSTAFGMCVWVTFISSYVLSRAMPRQPFGVVQSKIYPVYFRAMAYSIGIALLGHVLGHRKRLFISMPEILQAYNLLASLLTLFLNSLYLEPRATKLMFERMKIEKEEGRGREDMTSGGERSSSRTQEHHHNNTNTTGADPKEPITTTTTTSTTTAQGGTEQDVVRSRIVKLNEKLKRLNSYSSILNIVNLMSLTWHLVYLAQRLHLTC